MESARLKVYALHGRPRARGLAHGEIFVDAIRDVLELWGDALERDHGVDRRRYVELFFSHTRYEATTQRLAPHVLEEVRGIAEGANAPYRDLLAFQHVNEEFELAPLFGRRESIGEACSTIALAPSADRAALVAQNLDLAQYLDGFQVLFRVPCDRSDGEILALSVPGMVSLNGMNSHSFAVCDNTLNQLRPNPDGLPIYALYRTLLECTSVGEARDIVAMTPHAVGLNWVMGDPDGVVMIERSGDQSRDYFPNGGTAPAIHTNHPLACTDWASPTASQARSRPSRSSYLRLAALHQRLHGVDPDQLNVTDLQHVLSSRDDPDYPVSRSGGANLEDQQIGFTLASSVFELRRGDPAWHIAPGPPHETAVQTFRFS